MLYHFSENPNIDRFVPRPPLAHPETEPFVWVIDEHHSPLYFFPRDCPRAAFWPLPTTTAADLDRFWRYTSCNVVIAVEWRWLQRIQSVSLFRYTFLEDQFIPTHDHGVYVCRHTAVPISVEPVGDLLGRLAEAKVELRMCDSLVALGKALIESSVHYSLIRMRNAAGWTGTTGSPAVPAVSSAGP